MSWLESVFHKVFWVVSQFRSKFWKAFWVVSWFESKFWKAFWVISRFKSKFWKAVGVVSQFGSISRQPFWVMSWFESILESHCESWFQLESNFLRLGWTESKKMSHTHVCHRRPPPSTPSYTFNLFGSAHTHPPKLLHVFPKECLFIRINANRIRFCLIIVVTRLRALPIKNWETYAWTDVCNFDNIKWLEVLRCINGA